jgi:hypothetical protein
LSLSLQVTSVKGNSIILNQEMTRSTIVKHMEIISRLILLPFLSTRSFYMNLCILVLAKIVAAVLDAYQNSCPSEILFQTLRSYLY